LENLGCCVASVEENFNTKIDFDDGVCSPHCVTLNVDVLEEGDYYCDDKILTDSLSSVLGYLGLSDDCGENVNFCEPEEISDFNVLCAPECNGLNNKRLQFGMTDRERVSVMQRGQLKGASGRAVCSKCFCNMNEFLKLKVDGRFQLFCLLCAQKIVPNVSAIRLTKHGTLSCSSVLEAKKCVVCARMLNLKCVRKGRIKCQVCYRRQLGRVEDSRCVLFQPKIFAVPQFYDVSVPDFDVSVLMDFSEFLGVVERDSNLFDVRYGQLLEISKALFVDVTVYDLKQLCYKSIREQILFLLPFVNDSLVGRCSAFVESLIFDFQKKKMDSVLKVMFANPCGPDVSLVSSTLPDCLESLGFSVVSSSHLFDFDVSSCERYDLIVVYDQKYLCDLIKLMRVADCHLKDGGCLRIRVVNVGYGTLLYHYMSEVVLFGIEPDDLHFRDVEFYKFFFSVGFSVSVCNLISVNQKNLEICVQVKRH